VTFLIALAVVCAIIGYFIGQSKGRPAEGAAFGCILGPIGNLIALFLTDRRRKCQFCRESVQTTATVCPHCQRDLECLG
jgi:hypothetical protein